MDRSNNFCKRGTADGFAGWLVAVAVALALAFAFAFAAPTRAWAQETPDLTRSCTLSAECLASGKAVTGMHLSLYRVASFTESASFELNEAYQASGVEVNALNKSSEWAGAALTLSNYVRTNNLSPYATAAASSAGVVSFSGLKPGLYLVAGSTGYVGGTPYSCAPFLVSLPGQGSNGSWNYHVAVDPKFEQGEIETQEPSAASLPSILAITADGPQFWVALVMLFTAAALGVASWRRGKNVR